MQSLQEQILAYVPANDTEAQDKKEFLEQWTLLGDVFLQRPDAGHVTVSAMVLNPAMDAMLMVYHNIYQSLSWTGGHADGSQALLQKAAEEAREETGIQELIPLSSGILSLDKLPVKAHTRRGKPVAAHWHYNITYGFLASDRQPLAIKPDENSQVCWVSLQNWKERCSEPHMIPVYEKILTRMQHQMQEKQQRYALLPEVLLPWYDKHARVLPWRQDKDPYHIWLSEIMLQQTRVEAVKGYYQRFLQQLPDIAALAAAPEDQLLKLWEGLGYYSRVRNLQKAAKIIMEQYDGQFPADYAAIRALPGIGDYTAGAIASICFDAPTPAVDGNVLRVVSRITENFANVLSPAVKKQMAEALTAVYPTGEKAYTFNQSLMELGATVCLPGGAPKCTVCPLCQWCLAYARDSWDVLPQKAAKKQRRIEEKTVFVLQCGPHIAVQKRPASGLLAGLWQFPNIEGNLDTQKALDQAAAWDVKPTAIEKVVQGKHIFTHIQWHMTCYYLQCEKPNDSFFWADAAMLQEQIALPTAFKQFLE